MDMKEFTYLIALAEEGSISKAAERLYMAQSSLSQFLQQFESELGTRLFVRTSKGIHPTYSGECFIEQEGASFFNIREQKTNYGIMNTWKPDG